MLSDSISDRTLALLFLYNSVATRLMCRLICTNNANVPADLHVLLSTAKNLPELSIRIFNPLASYCWFIGMSLGSQISFADRWFWYFMLSDNISARTLLLLFLNCITTMHMNYSLFTLRSSLNLSYPPEHYSCCFSTTIPYKILYHHNAYELFTLHSSFFT